MALTADDKLILAHDENFVRLALDKDDPLVHKNVRELTYREIMSLPLKSGVRPPLLFDVLRSAYVIGGDAKMVVSSFICCHGFSSCSHLIYFFLLLSHLDSPSNK